jgi:hypothetical protein
LSNVLVAIYLAFRIHNHKAMLVGGWWFELRSASFSPPPS